ncbi:MAG: formylglycine-generating enzyme family protein [Treponema sp.]|nr:formylglycine-generating enzyme family protein [Treponema sp.]
MEYKDFTEPYDTQGYATIFVREDAKGYRLPTDVEWEFAARGGMLGDCYAGTNVETELEKYAWHWINNVSDNRTHEVMKKLPNAYGLYDMSGNVKEIVWDRLITRGGSYDTSKRLSKTTSLFTFGWTERYKDVGLRVVRNAQ